MSTSPSSRETLAAAGLTARQVVVLAMIYSDHKTQREVADWLRISQQCVSKLLRRAVRRLVKAGLPVPQRPPRAKHRVWVGLDVRRLGL